MTARVQQRKRPGPKPRLSRDEILDVALAILTSHGPEGLSLRRLGDELGVTARTLYGYFASKDDLESALVGRLIPEPPAAVLNEKPWDEQLLTYLLDLHDAMVLHPGVARLFVARSARNPATDRIREYLLELLLAGGLETDHAVAALGTLSRYLLGCVSVADERRRHQLATPATDDLPSEEFPVLRRVATQYPERNSMESTLFGMRLIVHGLASYGRTQECRFSD